MEDIKDYTSIRVVLEGRLPAEANARLKETKFIINQRLKMKGEVFCLSLVGGKKNNLQVNKSQDNSENKNLKKKKAMNFYTFYA